MAEPARFFTRARRVPILVGRLPDGHALPGGPYTLVQVLSGAGTGLLLSKTTVLWAHLGGLLDLVAAACVVVAVVWSVGKLPSSGRNPFTWFLGAVSLYCMPRQGSIRGRPLRVNRPRRVRHRMVVVSDAPWLPVAVPVPGQPPVAPTTSAAPPAASATPALASAAGPALTGVARLLAGAVTREDTHA